jgi:hypothetical protein
VTLVIFQTVQFQMSSGPDGESVEGSPVKCQRMGNESGIISLARICEDTAEEM